jgi:hypothetical protein
LQDLGQVPLLDSCAAFDQSHAISHILRPDFGVCTNNTTNEKTPTARKSFPGDSLGVSSERASPV